MGSLLERLEVREAATRARVEGLRAEMDSLAERLASEEELLGRLEITRQTIIEVLAGGDGDGEDAGRGVGVGVGAVSASQSLVLPVAAATAAGIPAGMGLQVPVFTPGGDVDGRRLPVAYRDAVEVLAEAGVPLRAMQVCQALGVGTEPRHREGMRVKLKRLAKRGWLVEASPGLFACASGVAGVLDVLDGGSQAVKSEGRS